ncbi:hypothetical protein ANN_03351 [Periplaneta americana]|uniref:DUF4817 domain-containing protein n=1 Tax=Periplaneta americana TaxID=6978 RepID=A0ABQ8TYV4_PERAM|nr:hypothetical protein ANN_03351 [Periplaneta americana]
MAGLCEGGSDPPGSLKAIWKGRGLLVGFIPDVSSATAADIFSGVVSEVARLFSAYLRQLILWRKKKNRKIEGELGGKFKRSLPSKKTLRGHSVSSFRGEGYIQCCVGVRLCDMYSNQELAEIHFMYGKADGNAALARRLYQERYPQRQCPDRKTFVRLHYRLCEYVKFNSPGLGRGRPRYTTPEVQEEILEAVNMTPSISTRRVALQVNVPHTTVWRLERVSIVSLSFATCTGPVTSRLPCTS